MSHDTLYILSLPGEAPCPPGPNRFPAILSHRISQTGQLLRLTASPSPRGGVMVICGCEDPSPTHPSSLGASILRECLRHAPRGLLLDLEAPSTLYIELIRLLSPKLSRLGITLFLPEPLAAHAPDCRALIPCALSGGSLELRLKEAVERYGAERVVACPESTATEFILPCPTGKGRPLSRDQLLLLLEQITPHTHFSPALCARYFTFFRDKNLHLVLFDDSACLREKYTCARRCGVFRFLLLQCDKSALFPDFSPQ